MSPFDEASRAKGNCGYNGPEVSHPCKFDEGWGTDFDTGFCKHHNGSGAPEGNQNAVGNDGGAPEGNQNAVGNSGGSAPEGNGNRITHGARADPTNLYDNLDEDETAWVDSKVDAYLEEKGLERDTPDGDLVELAVMSLYQARSAHGVLFKEGLSRTAVKGTTEHGAITDEEEHYLNRVVSQHTTDFRMALKGAGALNDPESQKADAAQSLVDILSE